MVKRFILLLALSLISATASADGTTGSGIVRMLHFYTGHTGLLIIHSNMMDPDACGSTAYIILPDNHAHYKDIYALLLAAKLSGQSVTINVSGCLQGYPQLRNIWLS